VKATPTSRDKQKESRASERSRQKLSESSDLAQALLRCAGTGIYIVQDGRFQYVNSLFQELTGYTEQELLGMHSLDLVCPEDREAVRKKAIESLKGYGPLPYEYRFMKKNGDVIWVLEKVTSTEYKGKRATVGSFMDITERKRLEEALEKSEERYRTILENMEDAYFEIDLAGNFTFFNDSMCRALGYSREELMGMDSRVCTAQEDAEPTYETLAEMYRTGGPGKIISLKFVRKDGGIRFSDTRISPLRNEKGEIVGFRGIGRDVTERRRLEQKLADIATHDPLTGLPNRLLLCDRLAVGLTQAQRNDTKLAVMMLDLDRFKNVNDTFGHSVGDELLRAAGERLTGLVRKSDTVARMGGDEFMVLLPQIAKIEDATRVTQKILEAFRKPFVLDAYQIHITTSIGIAIYPEDGEDVETLFKNADTAMYWVKEQGRDNYELYWYDGTKTL
jgi:diguanylate cyclase (GGDEF)-like protein/PAS domain S-box-containing protein